MKKIMIIALLALMSCEKGSIEPVEICECKIKDLGNNSWDLEHLNNDGSDYTSRTKLIINDSWGLCDNKIEKSYKVRFLVQFTIGESRDFENYVIINRETGAIKWDNNKNSLHPNFTWVDELINDVVSQQDVFKFEKRCL